MMEYMEDKFALKSQAMKTSDYYMDQVMESLDSAQYFTKSSAKCAQAFGLQSGDHRSSPCGDQNGAQLRGAKSGRRRPAPGARQVAGQLLPSAGVSGHERPGEDGLGRHGGQVRQQRVQQQKAETPDDVHQRAAGGAGESVPENPLPRCLCEGAAGHEDGTDGGQSAGVVSEQTSKVEETRALRTDPTSQNSLRSHLRFISVTEDRQLHADSQQPVAEPGPGWPRGLLLHAAPRLPSVRHLLRALPPLGRRRRGPRLRGLPQSAEPVRPRLPEQLLQRGLPPHAGRQRPPRLRGQARVRETHVQHRRAAHEGQRARGQHLVGHVIMGSRRV